MLFIYIKNNKKEELFRFEIFFIHGVSTVEAAIIKQNNLKKNRKTSTTREIENSKKLNFIYFLTS
jgi:hypothetical protein